jgi:hypothetical protein
LDLRKRARDRLKYVEEGLSNVMIIHYSCESFIDKQDGYSPRISAIGVRNADSGQTYSFSIHRVAELDGIPRDEIEGHYDRLEKAMMQEFFDFLAERKASIFVHWNMRDGNYGFQALYHRFRVLGGTPVTIDETRLLDLARTLVDIYGTQYMAHPRLRKLVDYNGISRKNFLTGEEEADAFAKKEYIRLHKSTLAKVDCITDILMLTLTGKLRTTVSPTAAKIRDIYDHWTFKGLTIVLALWGGLSILSTITGFLTARVPFMP